MELLSLEETWVRVCQSVRDNENTNPAQISAFFNCLCPQAIAPGYLMITADKDYVKRWVERNCIDYIRKALEDMYDMDFIVEIEVDENVNHPAYFQQSVVSAPAQQPAPAIPSPAIINTQEVYHQDFSQETSTPVNVVMPPVQSSASGFGSNIAASYTFANFVTGASNRLAYSMAVAVAEQPGKPNLNPLFIYGKSGLGKTHLLRAIQNYIQETRPLAKVIYIDSSEFLTEYATAASEHRFHEFEQKYMNADVLLIDDIQYLQGKSATLDEVFKFFNRLTSNGKQVVLSADRAPKNIDIDERYQSRFNQGGTFDIRPPEMETKLGIVKNFIEEYKQTEDCMNLNIPEDVQVYIAEASGSNIRELKSAVTKIIFETRHGGKGTLTVGDARDLLQSHFASDLSRRLNIDSIQKIVEHHYRITHADLVGPKRSRNIAMPRQVAMYLCRTMLDIPYGNIGKKFGSREHATVMYSVNQVEKRLLEDRDLQEEVELLTKLINES